MSDPIDASSAPFRTLQEAGHVIGAYCWVERRLFEILGAWVGVEADHRAKLLFAEHSRHHGWHSELWTARLPVARGLDAAELVVAPSAEARAVFDALAAVTGPDDTLARVQVLYGVLLPQLVAGYTAGGVAVSSVAERPTLRALTLIGRDDEADLVEGRALLDALAGGSAGAVELPADLADRLAELEARGGLLSDPARAR